MVKHTFLLIFIIFVNLVPASGANDESKMDRIIKISSYEIRSSEIITLSIEAIDRCFENIARGKRTINFPDNPGPMNTPFPLSKDHDYDRIVGYDFEESNPVIVTFLIGAAGIKGLHIAVVIDIARMEVVKVYNRHGS